MSHRHLRSSQFCALVLLVFGLAATMAFAQSAPVTINSVSPATINPLNGEYAKCVYTFSTTVNYAISVKNSAGTTVRSLGSFANIAPGTRSVTWGGKNTNGVIVPNGTYYFTISGSISSTGTPFATVQAPVTVNTGTVTPPPTTYAFAISGISPTTIDPSKGNVATISYNVPTTANYRVDVKNSAGAVVRTLGAYTSAAAGSKTASWDGKNASAQVVADGAYTVAITGTVSSTGAAITAAQGNITVSTTVTPPPTTGTELGQTIEGVGSANFSLLVSNAYKYGIAFQAPKTGTITTINLQWKKSSGYGNGNYGTYKFELMTNDANNFPSGTAIATVNNVNPVTAMDGYSDGAFHVTLNAPVTAGQKYHLVITNTASSPSSNWSSPNTLMTRVIPWDGTGCRGAFYNGSSWSPWTSKSNPWGGGTNNANGSHSPLLLTYSDGTNLGDPYYSAYGSAGAQFYGSRKYGEYMVWNQASATIKQIGISVRKTGTPDALIYHLEKVGSGDIATGTVNTSAVTGSVPQWAYATLSTAVTLQQGQAYRLWFESPSSSSSSYFAQSVPYGEARPAAWLSGSWGGTSSYYTYNTSGSWASAVNGDLSFSLK